MFVIRLSTADQGFELPLAFESEEQALAKVVQLTNPTPGRWVSAVPMTHQEWKVWLNLDQVQTIRVVEEED